MVNRTTGSVRGTVKDPNGAIVQGAKVTITDKKTNNSQTAQTGGRNTLELPGIRNLDLSVFKNFRLSESRKIQLRADFFNVLNHPQYTPGSVGTVDAFATTNVGQVNNIVPVTPDFNHPGGVFTNHPRIIQLAARFDF